MKETLIQSRQNPKVKFLAGLRKKRDREQHGCFLIEGRKELENFLAAGRILDELFHCPEFDKKDRGKFWETAKESSEQSYEFSAHAFEKVSARENPDGWLGLAKSWKPSIDDLQLPKDPLLLVLEGTEKPGNLGAILRTANAYGVDAVLCNEPGVDLFNPNVIRTSRGLVFSTKIAIATAQDTVEYLKKHNIAAVATICEGGQVIWSQDFKGPIAFVMGNEANGLSPFWQNHADLRVSIPSPGMADSLNLSTATAVCLYEVLRQRKGNP